MANSTTAWSGGFSSIDLERLWRLDSPTEQWPASTRLLLRRVSPSDIGIGGIVVSIDGRLLQAELRYGETVSVSIAAGAHVVRITNGWVARDLRTHTERGQALVVECGIGLRSDLWSSLLPRRLRGLNVWIASPRATG